MKTRTSYMESVALYTDCITVRIFIQKVSDYHIQMLMEFDKNSVITGDALAIRM